jgi:hypothetical protein
MMRINDLFAHLEVFDMFFWLVIKYMFILNGKGNRLLMPVDKWQEF